MLALAALPTVLALAALTGAGAAATGASQSASRPGPPTSSEVAEATRDFRAENPGARARSTARRGEPAALPIDGSRIVTYYGAPQLTRTVLGRNSVSDAKRKLERQARAYERRTQPPVVPGFDVIATIATADAGRDGLYRTRQAPAVLDAYQRRAQRLGGRLVLDIQPGRAKIVDELRALRPRIETEGVDVAIDPEWAVGRRGVPGRTTGHVNAEQVNRAAEMISRWSLAAGVGPKLLVVHQFREGSVANRGKIREPEGVDVVLNFDGIGSPPPKRAGYAALSHPRLDAGFSLFYTLDDGLMSPSQVMGLDPEARYVMYQ
ncbi:hypothetical protein HJD18_08390 [Thermoleophilia bacterium SCSIO 60948]|nr:hypothetical protein HJD18_08390 [Thermoleophilia bacterium SCSIO 60948]